MESQGYQDPVCAKDKCEEKKKITEKTDVVHENNTDDVDDCKYDGGDGYEVPEKTEMTITYDILSNSPVELFLFVDNLNP